MLVTQPTLAQLNESDTTRLQLRASLGGNQQQGNVEMFSLRSRLDISLAARCNLVFKSQNASLYQTFYTVKADNDLFSRNYLYFRPFRRLYPFAIGYVSTNYRRRIDLRYFAGAGGTVQLLNSRPHVLKLSTSIVYESSRFGGQTFNDTTYNGFGRIALWRATVWLGGWHYLFDTHLRLYYDVFYQPAFGNAFNYRWQADVGFDVPVWRGIAFSALYTYAHENVVVNAVRQNDALLTLGLSFNLRTSYRP